MPKFVVEMERDVTDTLRCTIEVEVDGGQNDAIKAARDIAASDRADWQFHSEVKRGRSIVRTVRKAD